MCTPSRAVSSHALNLCPGRKKCAKAYIFAARYVFTCIKSMFDCQHFAVSSELVLGADSIGSTHVIVLKVSFPTLIGATCFRCAISCGRPPSHIALSLSGLNPFRYLSTTIAKVDSRLRATVCDLTL